MKFRASFTLVIIALILGSCGFGGDYEYDESTHKEQIHAVLDSSVTAWNNGDIEGYMSFYYKI